MAGIGEASAILGIAQLGLQLAQTLVTVIGDYRDAAVNINRLRDEIHLTSICLQQLADLAQENRLIPGRGVLEATNLRERCRAVIWEIRTVIKKGDNPLHPDDITKDDIDVTYFLAWKWALWTKKHLEEPRLELDRLKDSMTLTFVTHMAILASSEFQRKAYTSQIPGIKRNVDWAEERYRRDQIVEEPLIPQEIIDAGPEEWQEFLHWKNRGPEVSSSPINVNELQRQLELAGVSKDQVGTVLAGFNTAVPDLEPEYQAWSLNPFVGMVNIPVNEQWIQKQIRKQTSSGVWRVHSKLQPWYKNQLNELILGLSNTTQATWSVSSLKLIRHSLFRRLENPPSLQIVLKGVKLQPEAQTELKTFEARTNMKIAKPEAAIPYSAETIMDENLENAKTDEEIIEEQLAKYAPERVDVGQSSKA